jgi:broad specificity phosphatase PhoE
LQIHVFRHGEAEDDELDAYGGAANFRLTDTGRRQAREAAQDFADAGIEFIYTSPLARASETAEILSQHLSTTPSVRMVSELRERNSYGVMSGVTKAKAAEIFDYVLADLTEKPGYSREPLLGAEDFEDFISRVRTAFEAVVADATSQGYHQIAIVTHGKFTQALFEFVVDLGHPVDLDLSGAVTFSYPSEPTPQT